MSKKSLVFTAAVRGFHESKTNWKLQDRKLLKCTHEEDNPYNIFPIKVCKPDFDKMVGHLLMEISRITNFIVDRGAKRTLATRGIHYRRSTFVQDGLQVLCELTIMMIGSVVNHFLLTWYKSLLKELYMEPKDEEIVGTFLSLAQYANENREIAEAEPSWLIKYKLRRTGLVINSACLFFVSDNKNEQSG